jgi:cobalt-zinc-cadmium efflux system membrane fusion protein
MSSRIGTFAARLAAQIPTILTLALLAGLAVWGAAEEWKVPRFSALWGDGTTSAEDSPAGLVKVIPDPSTPQSADPKAPATLWKRIEFPTAEAVRKAGIRVAPAQVQPMARYVTANGMLDYEPSCYAQLASRAPGTVWRVEKEIGDKVQKGEVLALVESSELGRAKADLVQNLAQVDVRTKTLQRLQSAGEVVSGGHLAEAAAALREARIRLFNDQQRLLNLGVILRLEDVAALPDDQLVRHLRLLGLPDAIRKQIDPETLTANLLPLTASFDCQVVNRRAAPGEVVDTARTLFVVADVRRLHIDLDVHLEDMAEVRQGQVVTFQPEANGVGAATAKISHISPEVDEKTRHVRVHAEVENPDGRLRPNTFGTGRILIHERPQAVVVPSEAVQSDGRVHLVFVRVSDESFLARPVQLGLRDANFIEVDGIQPGEMVATVGSFALKSELLKDRIGGGDD